MHARAEAGSRRTGLWLGLALAAGVAAIYAQTLAFDFLLFDDDFYVSRNPTVKLGLSWQGLASAFAIDKEWVGIGASPFPLTWLSHMAAFELFGLAAGGHHAINAALHACSAWLLFAALRRATDATWRSAAAAALWAWHPQRVESVAWISERNDVLSGVFAMLTLYCYVRHARAGSRAAWWCTLLCFALGLMSKPTLVPLPCALLLLDFWPLARKRPFARLVIEKLPLFALSALASALTLYFNLGWTTTSAYLSFGERVANALIALARYLSLFAWPRDLVVLYPHPYLPAQGGVAPGAAAIAAAAALVLGITLAVAWARRQRHLAVGWLWFLGMLAPTIGLVHVGNQAYADRYTYLPMIGVGVALVWGFAAIVARVRAPALRGALCAAAACALVGLGAAAFSQTRVWRNSETLFRHTLAVYPRASLIHFALGNWLREQQDYEGALHHYQTGLAIDPVAWPMLHFDVGRALHAQGRKAEAIEKYRQAAAGDPRDPRFAYQLGVTLEIDGRFAEAAEWYQRAVEIAPENAKYRARLAAAIAKQGGR